MDRTRVHHRWRSRALVRTGPIVAAARAVAGDAIDLAAVDTGGFRFAKLLDFRDPQFLPGGAKYLDLPGCLRSAPRIPYGLRTKETTLP